MVPGGLDNFAGGNFSLAAGRQAKADHDGTFVWADGTGTDLASTGDNQFLVRATGGVFLGVDTSQSGLRIMPGALESYSPNLIGGHNSNSVAAGKYGATIGGGGSDTSPNTVSASFGTVSGGVHNTASGDLGSTVGGGSDNEASDREATVAGGRQNTASGSASTVAGGEMNTASGYASMVPGGILCVADGSHSFAAGRQAKANHKGAFVWADLTQTDFASTADNQFLVRATGGVFLVVEAATNSGLRIEQTNHCPNVIGGYGGNSVAATVRGATIAGGGWSQAEHKVFDNYGTIGGGWKNTAGNDDGTTTNAVYATVGGGFNNTASWEYSTVGGGFQNVAQGSSSVVPGGLQWYAGGSTSFATGRRAKANHKGAFVWADNNDFDFASTAINAFAARCAGGARFVSAIDGSGNPTAGVQLASGGGSWSSISDRNAKANITPVTLRTTILHRAGRFTRPQGLLTLTCNANIWAPNDSWISSRQFRPCNTPHEAAKLCNAGVNFVMLRID